MNVVYQSNAKCMKYVSIPSITALFLYLYLKPVSVCLLGF